MHAAIQIEERAAVALREPIGGTNPFDRSFEVGTASACSDHVAAREHDGVEGAALAAERPGHRLVEERDAFVDPALGHQAGSQLGKRAELEIEVTLSPCDRKRRARQVLDLPWTVPCPGLEQHHPALELLDGALLDQTPGSSEPAGRRRSIANVRFVVNAQSDGEARGTGGIAATTEPRI